MERPGRDAVLHLFRRSSVDLRTPAPHERRLRADRALQCTPSWTVVAVRRRRKEADGLKEWCRC